MLKCTPVRNSTALGVDATPSDPDNGGKYPHFCPLCMLHFSTIFQTQCCPNTMCEGCAKSLIERSSLQAPLNVVLQRHRRPASRRTQSDVITDNCVDDAGILTPFILVPCPFCSRNLKLKKVTGSTTIKSYKDSPAVSRAMHPCAVPSPARSANLVAPQQGPQYIGPSPVKPGDDFEALRRKMIPLGERSANHLAPPKVPRKVARPVQQQSAMAANPLSVPKPPQPQQQQVAYTVKRPKSPSKSFCAVM